MADLIPFKVCRSVYNFTPTTPLLLPREELFFQKPSPDKNILTKNHFCIILYHVIIFKGGGKNVYHRYFKSSFLFHGVRLLCFRIKGIYANMRLRTGDVFYFSET